MSAAEQSGAGRGTSRAPGRQACWLVTPYFLDEYDPALVQAVPEETAWHCNAPDAPGGRSARELARLHRPIRDFVADTARAGRLPVSVAGDCVAALPVMAGLQRAGLAPLLVWLDAHGDFNTPETSPSGFLGGMALAMMAGRGETALPRASGLLALPERRIRLVGARDLDPLEARALAGARLRRLELGQLAALETGRPVHLHIDNDLLDSAVVPANNYPVPGGPGLEELIAACTSLARRTRIAAISLSGWNGRLPGAARTALACRSLLAAIVPAATAAC